LWVELAKDAKFKN